MNAVKIFIIIFFSIFMLGVKQSDQGKIQIWVTGPLHSDEIIGKTGEEWFGLYKTKNGYELIKSKVTVAESSSVGGLYDRYVTAGRSYEPIFLIRGIDTLKGGLIKTLISQWTFISPSESKSLKFLNTNYIFTASGKVEDKGFEELIHNYKVKLTVGRKTQTIASFKCVASDKYPRIYWAGDLDGDGKLDLVLDNATHYNVIEFTLFLSSAAQGDELVRRVASFRKGGC
jgi:hypothetical protein